VKVSLTRLVHLAALAPLWVFTEAALGATNGAAAEASARPDDGNIQVEAFTLPESSLMSDESRAASKTAHEDSKNYPAFKVPCPPLENAESSQWASIRTCQAKRFYESSYYKALRNRLDVAITTQRIGGVLTEVFLPAGGVAQKNRGRVLIKVHGGRFTDGARWASQIESIPIAALGKINVISIDYRQAPEYTFPAASQDVAAVYRELIETYKPQAIGIYGCSAGGMLTAQPNAWLDKEGLPQPGAAGMFCGAGAYWTEGDSGYFPVNMSRDTANQNRYLNKADLNDPLAFPVRSAQMMAKFPPSLLISGTRDFAMSSVIRTHSVLVAQGVEADLHIWEGMWHAFMYDPSLPDSREALDVIVRFFDRRLAQR
jgi:acetyl esterase/lipase